MQPALQTSPSGGIPADLRKKARDAVAGADMGPDDWRGLVGGLLKFLSEEADEDEHAEDANETKKKTDVTATDSALLLALDKDSVRSFDRDGRMHIAEANICKACVSPYRGSEIPDWEKLGLDPDRIYRLLRDPEALEKATPTLNGVQLLRKHIPVNADDHQPWDVVGSLGTTAKWESPYIKNGLSIWSTDDIEGVKSGQKRELSPGYHYRAVMEPGDFEGETFEGRMVDIFFNHVAIVEDGRQGPDIVVGDSADEILWAILETELLALIR